MDAPNTSVTGSCPAVKASAPARFYDRAMRRPSRTGARLAALRLAVAATIVVALGAAGATLAAAAPAASSPTPSPSPSSLLQLNQLLPTCKLLTVTLCTPASPAPAPTASPSPGTCVLGQTLCLGGTQCTVSSAALGLCLLQPQPTPSTNPLSGLSAGVQKAVCSLPLETCPATSPAPAQPGSDTGSSGSGGGVRVPTAAAGATATPPAPSVAPPGPISVIRAGSPALDTAALPAVQPLTPVAGLSFGRSPVVWPVILVVDLVALATAIVLVRRTLARRSPG